MGYYSDPYQPCEGKLRQTRRVLELLLERGFSTSILTKSDLVLRDVDLLAGMDSANVSVSVAFDDDRVRELFEANTIDTGRRIEALRRLKEAGVRTSALVCPVIPRITDVMALIDAVAPHAEAIWVYGLSVEGATQRSWRNVEDVLRRRFPELKEDIEAVVLGSNDAYWSGLRQELLAVQEKKNLDLRIHV